MRLIATLILLAAVQATAADRGVRFDSPGVIDLARREPLAHGKALPLTTLDAGAAQRIFAAPALDQDKATLPFSDYAFGCAADSKTCVPQHERQLIAESAGAVQRKKKTLAVKPAEVPASIFVDWQEPTTKTADGDGEKHWYLGVLPRNGFHQVEVQFEHDAPGSFLINAKSGKSAFVHSGSDIVAVSPDGSRLVTFNPDNPPLTVRIAALDDAGPRLELECAAGEDDRSTVQFKGWRDARGFDLVLQPERTGSGKPVAVAFVREEQGWVVAADIPLKAGLICRNPESVFCLPEIERGADVASWTFFRFPGMGTGERNHVQPIVRGVACARRCCAGARGRVLRQCHRGP